MHTIDPPAVGLSPSRLARIGAVMQGYVERGELAGLVTLLARRGQVAHLECFGLADREAQRPMHPDTIFRIYSMTKPVTSVAVMMLYEQGRFQLDDPASRFIPGFQDLRVCVGATDAGVELAPLARAVTIRHLLTHTSGLCYPNAEGSPVERLMWQSNREIEKTIPEQTLAEWVPRLLTLPLAHQPGSAWQYGMSTDVLGYLVEALSGQPFDRFLQEHIFAPLGMVDTAFSVPAEKVGRLAAMYTPGEKGGLDLADPPAGQYAQPRRFLSGGGGLVSTAGDYLRFAQMLLNRGELDGVRLLGRKTVRLMAMNHLPPPPLPSSFGGDAYDHGYGFGLGVAVLLDEARAGRLGSLGEYGWSGLAGTSFWVDPQEELIAIIMPQLAPRQGLEYQFQEQFRALVYQAIVD